MQAPNFQLDEKHLRDVVAAITAVDAPDGLVLGSEVSVQQIRVNRPVRNRPGHRAAPRPG